MSLTYAQREPTLKNFTAVYRFSVTVFQQTVTEKKGCFLAKRLFFSLFAKKQKAVFQQKN